MMEEDDVIDLGFDSVPFGGTIQKIGRSLWVDKDGDGRISFKELNWPAIGGIVSIAILLKLSANLLISVAL